MIFPRHLVTALLALFLAAGAPFLSLSQTRPSHSVAPEPSWIIPLAAPEGVTNAGLGGVHYVVTDRQIHVAEESVYRRSVKLLTSEEGLRNESTASFSYHPSHQKLLIHRIAVRRGGEVLDRLKPEALRVVQQETDASRHIYDEEESVLAVLEDIRIGDEIEVAYTVQGFNPVFAGKYADGAIGQWRTPVTENRVRLLWPKERGELSTRLFGSSVEPVVRDVGESREYIWSFKNLDGTKFEDDLPDWFVPYPWLQFSEFKTWKEVVDWARPLYTLEAETPAGIRAEAQRIAEAHTQPADRALAALRFVQEEIRYVGLEIGINSHKPNPPALTLSRRFGDCKDKVMLLCALLRELGIEAEPAAVNTYYRERVAERLPSPLAFNHVIARAVVDGKAYWLDPAMTHQRGGLADVEVDYYALALPFGSEAQDLAPITPKKLRNPTKVVEETYDFETWRGPGTLLVTTTFEGVEAEQMRRSMSGSTAQELGETYEKYYARLFSGVKASQPLALRDDPARNRITITENYTIEHPWSAKSDEAEPVGYFDATTVSEQAPLPGDEKRTMPLAIEHPVFVRHIISLNFPSAGQFEAERKVVQDRAQEFLFEVKPTGSKLRIMAEYKSLRDHAPPEEFEKHVENVTAIRDACSYPIQFPTAEPANFLERINWAILIIALGTLTILLLGSVYIYRLRPAASNLPPPLPEEINPKLQGLGGWLILPAIGLFLTPIGVAVMLYQNAGSYAVGTWGTLTTQGGSSYHPLFAPVLIMELVGNLTLFVMAVLLLVLFFQKRATFPRVYIAFLLFTFLFQWADVLGMRAIPSIAETMDVQSYKGAIRSTTGLLLWGAYMLKSRRVRQTFVR